MELNTQQKQAATYSGKAKNILVTAGAGCGKTRTIIARAAHLIKSGTDASRILMMTFTNRAAREMKKRLTSEVGELANQIQAGTFHSFCLKAIRKIPKSFGVEGLNIIDLDDQQSLMTIIAGQHVDRSNKGFPRPGELIKFYSYSRNTCQDSVKYLSGYTDLDEDVIEICNKVFKDYQQAKKDRGYLDFDDLLELFSQTLANKPALRRDIAKLFDELLVDEMQDTNPIQFSILKHFAGEGVRLFCVGDPAQSIYKFRGAEFQHVYKFQQIFANSEVIKLSLNYRSYQEILDFSNWLLDRSPLNYDNDLVSDRGKCGDIPSLSEFDNNFAEADWISEKIIERNQSDVPYNNIMVLVRTGFDARHIEAEFIQQEIPYSFIGGTSLTKSAHVRDVLSLLRVVRNDKDDLAWMRFLKLWPRIGPKTAEKIINNLTNSNIIAVLKGMIGADHKAIDALQKTASNHSIPKQCISQAVKSLMPILKERYDRWDSRKQDLNLLVTVSEKYKTISDFIDAFTLEPMTSSEIDKLENDDAVLLITVHSAKGTEAPICFVTNAKIGSYPHTLSMGDIDSEEEERRILYVALTRAKNELFITRSAKKNSGSCITKSPAVGEDYFLADVPTGLVETKTYRFNPDYSRGLSALADVY